jgi:methylase of polypeptide subunit release factors
MSEIFTNTQEQFQSNLRDLPYELRFLEVEKLTDQQKFDLAIDWKTPEHDFVFHKITLEGSKTLYFITDPLSYTSANVDAGSNKVFGLWQDEHSVTQVFAQNAVIEFARANQSDGKMSVFGLRKDGHYPIHNFSQPEVLGSIHNHEYDESTIRILDIGSGSGISAIITQNYLEELGISNFETIGIDLNARAIEFARLNTQLNNLVPINWKHEVYNLDSAPLKGCHIIHLNPPYNPRPDFLGQYTPKFADGWSEDATLNFKNQVSLAYEHLAPHGIMIINMMSPGAIGNVNKPLSVEYIQSIDPTLSIEILEIYEPFSAGEFLEASFADLLQDIRTADPKKVKQFNRFKDKISAKNNRFHYNVLVIKNDGKGDYKVHKSSEHNLAIYDPRCRQENHHGINIGSTRRMIKDITKI